MNGIPINCPICNEVYIKDTETYYWHLKIHDHSSVAKKEERLGRVEEAIKYLAKIRGGLDLSKTELLTNVINKILNPKV